MTAAQLTLDMAAPTGEPTPERLIAQAAHDETAAMISAVIGAIPMVGHRKGTARETVQRPVAYLYACRDRLGEGERELAISICSHVTRAHVQRIMSARVREWMGEDDEVERAPVWLRMNGEPARGAPVSTNARDAWRAMPGAPERDGYAWNVDVAQRAPMVWSIGFMHSRGQLGELAPEMLGTIAGWLLVLRWTPALAHVVRWRRWGCSLGPDMLVRRDQALAAGHVPEAEHAETYRLAQLDPATSMLARAVMAVSPRGDS